MKLNRWSIADLAGFVSACVLALLVLVAVSAVFLRYAVGAPLAWAEEIEIFSFLWIIMIGAIFAKRNNSLLRVDIIYLMLSPRWQRLVNIFQELVHIVIFCLMIYYGYKLALQVGAKAMPLLGLPLFWLYVSLPIGACGMLYVTVIQLYDLITGREAN